MLVRIWECFLLIISIFASICLGQNGKKKLWAWFFFISYQHFLHNDFDIFIKNSHQLKRLFHFWKSNNNCLILIFSFSTNLNLLLAKNWRRFLAPKVWIPISLKSSSVRVAKVRKSISWRTNMSEYLDRPWKLIQKCTLYIKNRMR